MLDQGLFKNHFVGRDGFIWWIGQIADENTWKANIPDESISTYKMIFK